jgi:hypothetical protein
MLSIHSHFVPRIALMPTIQAKMKKDYEGLTSMDAMVDYSYHFEFWVMHVNLPLL